MAKCFKNSLPSDVQNITFQERSLKHLYSCITPDSGAAVVCVLDGWEKGGEGSGGL